MPESCTSGQCRRGGAQAPHDGIVGCVSVSLEDADKDTGEFPEDDGHVSTKPGGPCHPCEYTTSTLIRKVNIMKNFWKIPSGALLVALALPAYASGNTHETDDAATAEPMAAGLILPRMDAVEGRRLFASKGCVVCHSVNGVGGEDAPMLDAELMDLPMNPFDFAARMWRGAEAMVELQRDELGDVIELEGEELASIVAFVHDADEQAKFSNADIPENVQQMMVHTEEKDDDHAD